MVSEVSERFGGCAAWHGGFLGKEFTARAASTGLGPQRNGKLTKMDIEWKSPPTNPVEDVDNSGSDTFWPLFRHQRNHGFIEWEPASSV